MSCHIDTFSIQFIYTPYIVLWHCLLDVHEWQLMYGEQKSMFTYKQQVAGKEKKAVL